MDLREEIQKEKERLEKLEEEKRLKEEQERIAMEEYLNSEEYKLKQAFLTFCKNIKIPEESKEKILDELQRIIDKKSYKDSPLYWEIRENLNNKRLPLELQVAFKEIMTFSYNDQKQDLHEYKGTYKIEYADENKYRIKERSLKRYNMIAFKKLSFEYYPALKEGKFYGDMITRDVTSAKFELRLPTDITFAKVNGEIKVVYTVYFKYNVVMLNTILPEDLLSESCHSELETYKGVMISKNNSSKDRFKIDLLSMLDKK